MSNLSSALNVDVENDQLTSFQRLLDRSSWRSVCMTTEDLRPFEKLTASLHSIEFARGDEVVVDAILLFIGPRTSRGGHAEMASQLLLHPVHDGRLAHAGGAGDNQKQAIWIVGRHCPEL